MATLLTAYSPDGVNISSQVKAAPSQTPSKSARTSPVAQFDGRQILRSEAEWKQVLTEQEYYVLRNEGTERAYTGSLLNNKKKGTYHCSACGLAVFASDAKYDSQTGWPSFFRPIYERNVVERIDRTIAEERTEIECARCGSHLGHVFDDGPQPTGLRYCINSIALRFAKAN